MILLIVESLQFRYSKLESHTQQLNELKLNRIARDLLYASILLPSSTRSGGAERKRQDEHPPQNSGEVLNVQRINDSAIRVTRIEDSLLALLLLLTFAAFSLIV